MPMFRGDPGHTGAFGPELPRGTPREVWSFDTGGTVESTPTVWGDFVFVGTFADHLLALRCRDW